MFHEPLEKDLNIGTSLNLPDDMVTGFQKGLRDGPNNPFLKKSWSSSFNDTEFNGGIV
jgi:hypothetical protein